MFILTKKSSFISVNGTVVGDTFEFEADDYIRIDFPKKIGEVKVPLTENDVVCLSLSSFKVVIFDGSEEVKRTDINATAIEKFVQ
jgi:hypothetical protein